MTYDIQTLIARLADFAPATTTSTPQEREQFRTVVGAVRAIDTSDERNREITEIAALIADEHMDYLVHTKRLSYVEALERVLIAAAALQERYRSIDWEAVTMSRNPLAFGLPEGVCDWADAVTEESARLLGVWRLSEN